MLAGIRKFNALLKLIHPPLAGEVVEWISRLVQEDLGDHA
jgi:hypothetical protein